MHAPQRPGALAAAFSLIFLTPIACIDPTVVGDAGQPADAGAADDAGAEGCGEPAPLIEDGVDTGFVRDCDDDVVHRVDTGRCDPVADVDRCVGDEFDLECTTDADCTDGPNGVCGSLTRDGDAAYCGCVYTCETDADCGAGEACVCSSTHNHFFDGAWSTCVPASCGTDADCAAGDCALSHTQRNCGMALACQAPSDACRSGEQCDEDGDETCAYDEGAWQCVDRFACSG